MGGIDDQKKILEQSETIKEAIGNPQIEELAMEVQNYEKLAQLAKDLTETKGKKEKDDTQNSKESHEGQDFRREYTWETFNKYRERFSKFFNLEGKGYEITRIWVETNTEKLRFEIKYTTDNDYDISQKVYANITGQYQEDINDDNSFKVLDIRYSPIIGTYKVENGEVFVHDLVYDVPHIADKPSKKMDFDCLFNPDATDRHVREILEKKKATFDNFHIDKELAPKDYPQMRYNADLIKKGQPRNYETSAMAKIDLDKSLKNNIVLDKNITKEDKESPYERKLLYKYGEGENDYLDLGHTIEYGFDDEGNLEIQGGLSGGEHITINGFLFYNVKIEKDPNDPLNVHISFDQDELKEYGEHMKTGFMKICEAINSGSIGAEFTNLNKTVRRMQGADWNSVNAFDGTKIKGFYSVELYAPTENAKKTENTQKDILYLQYDKSEGIQIIDACGKSVEQMSYNSDKTVIEPSIIGGKLRLRETKGKAPEYQYLTINIEGHQNLQGRVNEDGPRTEASDEVYWPMALIENGKQYAEFTVNWNEKTGYSFEQENNEIDLKPEYFYHKLPDINQLGLNGKIAGFSDSTLKKNFDQEFALLNLEPQSWIVFDGKFYKVEVRGNILTLKEEYPPEVKKCNEKIEKKVNAIKAMADNLKIMYGGKSMDKVQGGSMGFWTFFKLENFDPDGFAYWSENLSFVCQMTNLEDEEDIVFEYNEDKGIFEFVPDPNADPANTFTISDNTYKISYDSKKYTIKLDLQDYKNDDAEEPKENGEKKEDKKSKDD